LMTDEATLFRVAFGSLRIIHLPSPLQV
jgi:hypothetical protein